MTARHGPLVVIGDALLDRDLEGTADRLCPDAPVPVVEEHAARLRPGGAGLAALLAVGGARDVVLVSALGTDAAGDELRRLLARSGVLLADLGRAGATPEKTRVLVDGRSLLRVDRGTAPLDGGRGCGRPGPEVRRLLGGAGAILVSDYGHGVPRQPDLRRWLARLDRRTPLVWDPHPRGTEPVPGVRVATPNRAEARRFAPEVPGDGLAADAARARALAGLWAAAGVALTRGRAGALLAGADGVPLVVPAAVIDGADPCGAGDCFAATTALLLAEGALPSEAVSGAVVAASAFVAAGGAGGPGPVTAAGSGSGGPLEAVQGVEAAVRLAVAARERGETVVAAGGCFDVLHAGHAATLSAARRLGDVLVVCLNSDASVRRLKGPGRPVVAERERAQLLAALGCVDAVAVFDEPTPARLLERLRPHVFAKGGDYTDQALPERTVLQRWGGVAVTLPYLPGRSTTQLLDEVRRAG